MRKPVFTDFLPGATPTTKETIRSGPVQGPQKPSVANIIAPKLTREETVKADAKRAAAKSKKVLKPVRIGKDVYDYEFTGWDTMTPAQKQKALDAARADILANDPTADKTAVNPYAETKPFTGGDAVKAVANQVLGTAPGVQAANAVASTPLAATASKGLRGLAKNINVQVPESKIYDQEGLQMLADLTVNAPSQTVGAAADLLDKNTDNIGRVSSGLQLGATFIGAGQAVKAGKKAFDLARKTGSFGKALLKGIEGAVGDSVGVTTPDVPVQPKAAFDLPTTPKATPPTDDFATQQRAMLRGVLGADDVSGVDRIANKVASVKLNTDWKEPFIPEKYGKTADEVLKNGGKIIDDAENYASEYAKSLGLEKWTTDYAGMEKDLREKLSKVQRQIDKHSGVGEGYALLVKESNGYKAKLQEVLDGKKLADIDNAAHQNAFIDGLIKYGQEIGVPGLFSRSNNDPMRYLYHGGSMFDRKGTVNAFIVAKKPVPEDVLNEFPNLKKIAEERGLVAKPIEQSPAPNPTQPLQPQPVAQVVGEPVPPSPAPKIVDMAPKSPEPATVPTGEPQRVTGLSNAANLTDFEQGILKSAPEGKGRSVKEIYESNRNRKDFDDVADRVAKGESLTADNAAAILAGRGEYTAKVRSAKEALDKAITEGLKPDAISALQKSLDDAIENATEYAAKVQRGKSEWSDIGRTLAAYLDVDTRDIASVLQEARLRKGAALTTEEVENYTNLVNDLRKTVEESKAEIERLMKAHADNATKVAAARKIVRTPEARAAKRKQALDEFLTASSGLNAYVNPKVIKQFAKYMYTLIEDGARSVEDIVAAAAKDGVKADFEDVYAAMRSQVKESTLSDLQKEIAKTKRELMAAAKADTPEAKAAAELKLQTKAEIKAWNEAEKLKAKEEADILRNLKADTKGITREQRLARQKELDEALGANAKADNLRGQIVKLLEQAEDGTLPAPQKREIDARVQALEKERRKALKAAQDASPEYQAVKDFKSLEANRKRLQGKIKTLEERIANKDYAEVSVVKQARKTDDELDKLRQKVRVKESIVKAGIESARPKTRADKVGNFLNEIKLLNPASRAKDFAANTVKGADFVAMSIIRRGVDNATAAVLGELPITKGTTVERTQRILDKAGNRLKADAELIVKGADPDSVKKYGSYKGIGGKAAGLTDVPFKSFYYEWMSDAAADFKARKKLGNNASPEAIATEREAILANIDDHPDIQLMAEEYALNQTFNNSNWASELVGFSKRKASGAGKVAIDEFIGRFAKVITNVATDATDRTGLGIFRGGYKIAKAKALGNSLSVSERAIINDMITKGATGVATLALGYFLGDKIPGTIKGERGKYVDFGDLESIGGPISPLLLGAIYKKSESIEDPEQRDGLRLASVLRLPINTPLASNSKDLLNALTDSSSTQGAKKLLARKISNVFIPGGVRDIAERMDSGRGILTGSEIEREKIPKVINPKTGKDVQTKNFIDILKGDIQSKIPVLRQRLPIKKTEADKKKEAEAKKSAILK